MNYKIVKPITLTTSNLHSKKSLNNQAFTVSNQHQMFRNNSALDGIMPKTLPKSQGYIDAHLSDKEILKFDKKVVNDQERSEQNQNNYSNFKLKFKGQQFQKISLTSYKNNNSYSSLKNMSQQNQQSTTSLEELYSPSNLSLNIEDHTKGSCQTPFYKVANQKNIKFRNITPNSKIKTEQAAGNPQKPVIKVRSKQQEIVQNQYQNFRKNSDNNSQKALFNILNPEKNKISLKEKSEIESNQQTKQPNKFTQFKKIHYLHKNSHQVKLQSPTSIYQEKSTNENKFSLSKTYNNFLDIPQFEANVKKHLNFKKQMPAELNSINYFQLGKKIGSGKFGDVFLAKHIKINMIFAVKKISKQIIKQFKMQKQLAQQINIQFFLNHPNIVNLYTFFGDQQHIYLILEYMPGGTLFDDLQERKVYPEEELARVLKSLISALKYLHDHQIAHRDIKPENILINNGVMKICDFGWAGKVITPRKTYCGTLDYACPEILQRKQYGLGVDIWCLGILIYELLTGRVPFQHKERKLSIKKIINVDKQKILYPCSMSKEARNLIQNLLKKNPDQRLKIHNILNHEFFNKANDQQF